MSALDWIRDKLLEKGYTKQQVNSSVVPAVVDILDSYDDEYAKIKEQEDKETERLKEIRRAIYALEVYRTDLKEQVREQEDLLERYQADADYIAAFNKALENCETAEGRDMMRRAQVFVNSVFVDTKYDNTAYIIGLSAILSSGEIGPLEAMRKLNPDVYKRAGVRL